MATTSKLKKISQFRSGTPDILQKIQTKGLSIADLAASSVVSLVQLLEEPEQQVEKIIAEAKKSFVFDFQTIDSLRAKRALVSQLDTGCKSQHDLLRGGIETPY